jgi:hypothetical protein
MIMNANERHHRSRHTLLALLELLALALFVAGVSVSLLRTVANALVETTNPVQLEQPVRFGSPGSINGL